MILRRSFLKYLLAPLLAPLVKFLPERGEPYKGLMGAFVRAEQAQRGRLSSVTDGPRGVIDSIAFGDCHKGDPVSAHNIGVRKAPEGAWVVGYALNDASTGENVQVILGPRS